MNHISIVFSLLSTKTLSTFASTDFSCDGFVTLTPLTLTLFKAMHVTLKYTWFLKIDFCFVSGKDNFDCSEVSTHGSKLKPVKLSQYLGAFHLCGIAFSFLIFYRLKLSSQLIYMYIRVTMSINAYKCNYS